MNNAADTARAQIFGDSLACEDTRPATFLAGVLTPTATRQA